MKKGLIAIIIGLVLMTACAGKGENNIAVAPSKPKIETQRRLPKIPPRELKASVLESIQKGEVIREQKEQENFLRTVEEEVVNPLITQEDLDRGWYFGKEHEKRYATPESWVFLDRGEKSVWMRPGTPLENPFEKDEALCESSSGYYQYSCYDYQAPQCKYVGKSKCECLKGTNWLESQGCILIDDLNDFVTISKDELKQGWYEGAQSMKKKGTPYGWKWVETKSGPRWQNAPAN